MKKALFITVLASLATLFSCSQPGAYTIKGSADCLADGDTVFVVVRKGREMNRLDSAIVNAGKFVFKGVKETPELCNLYSTGKKLAGNFFLEEGKMTAVFDTTSYTVSGSANNDIFNAAQEVLAPIREKQKEIYDKYYAEGTTQEEKDALVKESGELGEQYDAAVKEIVANNISNPVGIYYFKQSYYDYDAQELHDLINAIPEEQFAADERLAKIKDTAEKKYATREGQKFVDISLNDPKGNKISLSDYAGKGKYVLVDFWASWCGPCCAEMPNVVELYNKYKKSDKFEIVGVSLDSAAENWTKALDKYNMTWPQMSDLKGWSCEGAALYGVNSIPHTVLIDPQGIILQRDLRGEKLAEKLAELIK